jgi:outer membrane receptor protein involved in Fe transport
MLSHIWEKPQIRWAVNWSANLNSYLSIYDAEEDEVRQLRQNGFSMGDVQASRKFLNRHLNVGLGVRNLLNVTEALQSNRAGIHSSGNGNTFISNGRTVFINLVLDVSK